MRSAPPAPPVEVSPGPTTAIDPRIRARRIEVRRDAGRRRLHRVVEVGLVLGVAAAFVLALRSPLLDVDAIRVAGASRTGAEAVAAAARIELGDQLMDVDLGAAGARVADLPWVGRVDLHRGLDGVVRLEVVERAPAATVGTGAAAVLVDATGRVLAPVADAPDLAGPLVAVVGVGDPPAPGTSLDPEAQDALRVAASLAEAVPGAVASVAVDRELVAVLADGGEVLFGDTSRLTAKVRSLQTVLGQVDLECLATLDLRVPTSPVLTRHETCS